MKGRGKARENYTERRGREEGRIKRDEETVRGRQNERRRGTDNGRLKRGEGGGEREGGPRREVSAGT